MISYVIYLGAKGCVLWIVHPAGTPQSPGNKGIGDWTSLPDLLFVSRFSFGFGSLYLSSLDIQWVIPQKCWGFTIWKNWMLIVFKVSSKCLGYVHWKWTRNIFLSGLLHTNLSFLTQSWACMLVGWLLWWVASMKIRKSQEVQSQFKEKSKGEHVTSAFTLHAHVITSCI